MANPSLPPYLGTWEELVQALLHNPFLGGGRGPHPHALEALKERLGPAPDPWSPTASLLVLAASLRDLASHLPEGQKGLGAAISQTVADWEDGICPPPRPRPHVIAAAVELLAFADTIEAGSLRTNMVREAGTILEKSFATGGQGKQVTSIAS
jgi:hypothetical protein